MDEFRAGVTASLRSWSALRTAVESGWGGADSLQKAQDLRANIFEHFDGSSVPPKAFEDVMDLEDSLAIFMEEEFSLTLEDGSERQVADVIWRLYAACARGDVTLAHQVVAEAERAAVQQPAASAAAVIQSPEQEDDDDEEMMDTTEPTTSTTTTTTAVSAPLSTFGSAAEYALQPLFGPPPPKKAQHEAPPPPVRQLGEAAAPIAKDPGVALDEDGFAPVVKGKRRNPL